MSVQLPSEISSASSTDSSNNLPPGIKLLPGERLKPGGYIPQPRPPHPDLSDEQILLALARVDSIDKVGTHMPFASVSLGSPGQDLFAALFFRDASEIARGYFEMHPRLMLAYLRTAAEYQGRKNVPGVDREKFGQIPHEHRFPGDPHREELTRTEGWVWPHFGAIDTTSTLMTDAVNYEKRFPGTLVTEVVKQSDGVDRPLASMLGDCTRWVLTKMSENEQGFIEAANNFVSWQVWQDSRDAYHHSDGRLARGLVAAVEVQAATYSALIDVAELMESNSGIESFINYDPKALVVTPQLLRENAEKLKNSIFQHMWVEENGHKFFAIGSERFEGKVSPLKIRNVNMGLVLDSRLLEGPDMRPYREALVKELLLPKNEFLVPTGLRTLTPDSSRFAESGSGIPLLPGSSRFREAGYHTGSVWPHATFRVARGLHRHGFHNLARQLSALPRAMNEATKARIEKWPGTYDLRPKLEEHMLVLISPDGHGGTLENPAEQAGQILQGWNASGDAEAKNIEKLVASGDFPPEASGSAAIVEREVLKEWRRDGRIPLFVDLPADLSTSKTFQQSPVQDLSLNLPTLATTAPSSAT